MHCELYSTFYVHTHRLTSFPSVLLASWMSIFWFIIVVSWFDSVLFLLFFTISKVYLRSIWLINRSLFELAQVLFDSIFDIDVLALYGHHPAENRGKNVNGFLCVMCACKCPLLQVKLIILINHWVKDDQCFSMMIIDHWTITINCA